MKNLGPSFSISLIDLTGNLDLVTYGAKERKLLTIDIVSPIAWDHVIFDKSCDLDDFYCC